MKDDDHRAAIQFVLAALSDGSAEDAPPEAVARQVVAHLCLDFHLMPRYVMRGHPPTLLREQARILETEGRPWMGAWFRELADATED